MKVLLATLVLLPAVVQADQFRCPGTGKIISEGMSQYEVESKCGVPAGRTPLNSISQSKGETLKSVQAEQWNYDFGSNQLSKKLSFENGSLKKIETGGYGAKNLQAEQSLKK